jgi:hypothetical protein
VTIRSVKNTVPVIFLTSTFRLEGDMHVIAGGRLLDEINKERDFIPLTNATIYDATGTPLDSLDFIAINKSQILVAAPATPKQGDA